MKVFVETPVSVSLIDDPDFDLLTYLKDEMINAAQAHIKADAGGLCDQVDGPFDVSPSFPAPVEGRKIYTAWVQLQ